MKRIAEFWLAFVHWRGWKAFGGACIRGWNAFVRWKLWKWQGWKKLFFPHPAALILAAALSAAGLAWVFLNGRTEHPAAYGIYCFSAYALTAAVLRSPGFFHAIGRGLRKNRVTNRILTDGNLMFSTGLYIDQGVNLIYGGAKIIGSFLYASSWLMAEGLYHLVQGFIQLFQILQRKKNLTVLQQWKSYRLCGVLMLLMHLSMTGVVFLMIRENHGGSPGYLIFLTALFAFYKLINSFVRVAKDRKHTAPVNSAVRMLKLSQAFFAMFSLQVAMFQEFGGEFRYQWLMNSITGGAVCVLVVSMGVYMIYRANRDMKKTELEDSNGTEEFL